MNKLFLFLMGTFLLFPFSLTQARDTADGIIDEPLSVVEALVCIPWAPAPVTTLGLNATTLEAKKASSNNIFSKGIYFDEADTTLLLGYDLTVEINDGCGGDTVYGNFDQSEDANRRKDKIPEIYKGEVDFNFSNVSNGSGLREDVPSYYRFCVTRVYEDLRDQNEMSCGEVKQAKPIDAETLKTHELSCVSPEDFDSKEECGAFPNRSDKDLNLGLFITQKNLTTFSEKLAIKQKRDEEERQKLIQSQNSGGGSGGSSGGNIARNSNIAQLLSVITENKNQSNSSPVILNKDSKVVEKLIPKKIGTTIKKLKKKVASKKLKKVAIKKNNKVAKKNTKKVAEKINKKPLVQKKNFNQTAGAGNITLP